MKQVLLVILFFFPAVLSSSQDVIYKRNGSALSIKILHITPNDIMFVNGDSLKTEIQSIPLSDVFMVRFASGVEEVFGNEKYSKYGKNERFFSNGKNTYYYSVGIGVGPDYGFLGFRLQGRIGKLQGIGYHAGIGIFPIIALEQPARVCFSIGVKVFMYKAWYLGLQYGRVMIPATYKEGVDTLKYYDQETRGGPVMGMSLMAGGDWFFNKYLGMNAAMGISFNLSDPTIASASFAIGFGLIYKFGKGIK
jgi:hypothetical protein